MRKDTILAKEVTPYGDAGLSKKQQVEQMFDNIAHSYDFLNHFLSLGIDNIWRRKAIAKLKGRKLDRVLDVATGTGDFAIQLHKQLKPGKIIGVDISEKMLAFGEKKIQKKGLGGSIEFARGDSENLQFADNTFDAVTVAYGVRNFEDLQKGLGEIHRVMKDGGKLVVLEFSQAKAFPVKQLFELYFNYILPVLGRMFSKDTRAYTYLPESVKVFPEGQSFIKELQKAGFDNTSYQSLTFGICSVYTGEK